MSVYTIWESTFPIDAREEGTEVTSAIWRDMPEFEGYVGHETVEDLDRPGHLMVIGAGRVDSGGGRAGVSLEPDRSRADALVSEPRRRFVGRVVDAGTGA